MDKVNEFEHGIDRPNARMYVKRFSDKARDHYTYSGASELLDNLQDLSRMIKHHHEHQRPRLDILDDYYEGGNSTILQKQRRIERHLADHRSPHNFAEYVSQFIQGYMCGIPIKVQHDDENINELVMELNAEMDADAHNSDLILDLSIYGRAYELLYRNYEDEDKLALLSPLETFVIYTDTVEKKPIAAVRYYRSTIEDNVFDVELYTNTRIHYYKSSDAGAFELRQTDETDHYFGDVPIVEYTNNRFRQGDYEKVLDLIDLYDAAQADTANYMTDLNDAMLLIKGNVDFDSEEAKRMKESNILLLQTEMSVDGKEGSADAEYIYKQYDVSGVESYKDRIENDIHKFTNTPNMNDESFSGTQSGEAMKYKLFGLEQKRAIKERLFKRSMMHRYRLLNNILSTSSEGAIDLKGLTIKFTPNLPENLIAELDAFFKGGGKLSQETLLSMLSLVEDPQKEMERLAAETQDLQDQLMAGYQFAQPSVGDGDGSET